MSKTQITYYATFPDISFLYFIIYGNMMVEGVKNKVITPIAIKDKGFIAVVKLQQVMA